MTKLNRQPKQRKALQGETQIQQIQVRIVLKTEPNTYLRILYIDNEDFDDEAESAVITYNLAVVLYKVNTLLI